MKLPKMRATGYLLLISERVTGCLPCLSDRVKPGASSSNFGDKASKRFCQEFASLKLLIVTCLCLACVSIEFSDTFQLGAWSFFS